jgi:hypothetical protein
MWGKERKKEEEEEEKKDGVGVKFVPVVLEFKTVTLPLHWIILKMGIISHFNFIHIFPPLMWA